VSTSFGFDQLPFRISLKKRVRPPTRPEQAQLTALHCPVAGIPTQLVPDERHRLVLEAPRINDPRRLLEMGVSSPQEQDRVLQTDIADRERPYLRRRHRIVSKWLLSVTVVTVASGAPEPAAEMPRRVCVDDTVLLVWEGNHDKVPIMNINSLIIRAGNLLTSDTSLNTGLLFSSKTHRRITSARLRVPISWSSNVNPRTRTRSPAIT